MIHSVPEFTDDVGREPKLVHPKQTQQRAVVVPRGLTLADLTQDHIDDWIAGATSQRRYLIRYFLKWTTTRRLTRELAAADRDVVDAPLDPVWAAWSGRRASVPLLPAAPAGTDDDEAHAMVRIMCEDIASSPLNGQTEENLLRVLAAIDRLPVGYCTDLGRLLLHALQTLRVKKPDQTGWQFRTFRPTAPGEVQLGFGVCTELTEIRVCTELTEITRAAFRSWFLLRHHERSAVEPLDDRMSVGVLLTPDRTGRREWDTTTVAITGDPKLSPEELAASRRLWNREG